MTTREHTREVRIGDRVIGGGNPILIQSMTNTRTEDVDATVEQILRLEKAGCELIRSTVPTMEAAAALSEIKKKIHIPHQCSGAIPKHQKTFEIIWCMSRKIPPKFFQQIILVMILEYRLNLHF